MAETTVISRPAPGQIDDFVLDAVITETHVGKNTITKHPVEEGSDFSDHSRPEPDTFTMECVVSSTPISGATESIQLLKGVKASSVAKVDEKRVKDALDKLDDIRAKGRLITVVTSLRTYDSVGIESATITRDAKTQAALKFSAAFQRVRVVKNKLTSQTVSKDKRAKQKTKTGAAADKATEPEQDTALKKIVDFGISTFGGK